MNTAPPIRSQPIALPGWRRATTKPAIAKLKKASKPDASTTVTGWREGPPSKTSTISSSTTTPNNTPAVGGFAKRNEMAVWDFPAPESPVTATTRDGVGMGLGTPYAGYPVGQPEPTLA